MRKQNNGQTLPRMVFLGVLVGQWVVLARLTWWEFNWDVMEPITYFVTFGSVIVGYVYFMVTKKDYGYENWRRSVVAKRMYKLYVQNGFPIDKYFHLEHKIKNVDPEAIENIEEEFEAKESEQTK